MAIAASMFLLLFLNKFLVADATTLTVGFLYPVNILSRSVEAAAAVGIQEIKERHLLDAFNIKVKFKNSFCDARTGMQAVVNMWSSEGSLDVIIGAGCSGVCMQVGLLAAAWNLPEISPNCQSDLLSDREVYPTFIRTVTPISGFLGPALALLDRFKWHRLAIISGTSGLHTMLCNQLKAECEKRGYYVTFNMLESILEGDKISEKNLAVQRGIVRTIKSSARIVFIYMTIPDSRNFLVSCLEEGLYNGEYVFIGLEDMFYSDRVKLYRSEVTDEMIREGTIYIFLDRLSGSMSAKYVNDMYSTMADMNVSTAVNPTLVPEAMLTDAVLLWAYTANKTIENGERPNNGTQFITNVLNTTVEGVAGTIDIDGNGVRLQNFGIFIWQRHTAVHIFQMDSLHGKLNKVYKPDLADDWSGLLWSGNATSPPSGVPECGWNNEHCQDNKRTLAYWVTAVTVLTALILLAVLLSWRMHKSKLNSRYRLSLVAWSDVKADDIANSTTSLLSQTASCRVARVGDDLVVIKMLGTNTISSKTIQHEVMMMGLRHENINAFSGLCLEGSRNAILMAHAQRGSLYDVIHNSETNLTLDIKQSLIMDIAQGMNYLHSSDIAYHGHLTSHNCVIDQRWICKITDYGLRQVIIQSGVSQTLPPEKLLWTAPELLNPDKPGSQPGDVYSYGVIIQEVMLQDQPYAANSPSLDAPEIIDRLRKGDVNLKPYLPEGSCSEALKALFDNCLLWDSKHRPTFSKLIKELRKINDGMAATLVDKMIIRLENHTQNLEAIVSKRTMELQEEKLNVENLLKELLPESVVHDTRLGRPVFPEQFENVTVFFSDIVSFTKISAAGTPMDVVRMLNLMYIAFDDVSSQHNVYKVATIGDAYFVASGVPVRNKDHAREIANMALGLLEAAGSFAIPHLSDQMLQIRAGVHSGPCVAGVVGVKTPRYLLFGDTVNTASMMESSGEAMKIHVSDTAATLLINYPDFDLQERYSTCDKEIGTMTTYWLRRK